MTHPGTVALDTSAYSHMIAGHEGVLDAVARAEVVYVPAIVLGELEAAFRLGRRQKQNHRALTEFLDEPFVEVLSVTPSVAQRYGRLFAELRTMGRPLPISDVWIAATSLDGGAHLLTFDRDFERIVGLDHTLFDPA